MARTGMISIEEDMMLHDDPPDRDINGRLTDYKRNSILRFLAHPNIHKEAAAQMLAVTAEEIEETLAWKASRSAK